MTGLDERPLTGKPGDGVKAQQQAALKGEILKEIEYPARSMRTVEP